jgi:ATP-dependent Clp protease protease subunit
MIQIVGDITEEAYALFSKELAELESGKTKKVTVELFSHGGDAHAALAFYSRIINSPCTITIRAMGYVASAAVLILAAGDHRIMAKEAWVMVHEDSGELSGDVVSLEREARQMRQLETQWARLLAERTDISAGEWTEMHKETTFLTAGDAWDMGLVDEVL